MLKNMKEGVFKESGSLGSLLIVLIWKKMDMSVSLWATGS